MTARLRWDGDHVAFEAPGGRALFTTRRGGVSEGPYSSLNLGVNTDDDPAAVRANRRLLADAAGVAADALACGRQVHGARVRRVAGAGAPSQDAEEDGQATAREDVAVAVFTADCLPVALIAPGGVAVLHGGWRGLAAGIVAEGVRALCEVAGCAPSQIAAALGPSARGCCYEVGEEVHAAFAGDGARVGARNLALERVARRRLEQAGVGAAHDCELCTMCRPELFFSHRRDRGLTGRQGAVAWRA